MQDKEFSDGSGLELYDFNARTFDHQTGRFIQADPLSEKFAAWTPYTYSYNNPIRFGDPTGMSANDWVGRKNKDGSVNFFWDDNIKSEEEAKNAGYDDYKAPGSRIQAKVGDGPVGTVYLGHGPRDAGYDESNFDNWLSVNGDKYSNQVEAFRAWQSYPGKHTGEEKWDRLLRFASASSMEARREFGSGGTLMYNGWGRMAKAVETVEKASGGAESLINAGINWSKHSLQRLGERGITQKMAETAINRGQKFYDPLNGTINYVLPNGFASGKSLLVGTNPLTGQVTTVLRSSKNLVNSRFIPIK